MAERKEIKRILIANRGEIALRAIRTIKEMGKEAVAVYSTGDKEARYLSLADAAICIGSEKSAESYLNIPAIISAAELSGCDAVFPGYGFLSENQDFVEICERHGITFIGPSVEVMNLMADKSKAKQVMAEAGVPTIPGSDGAVEHAEEARALADEMGYPVILKAAAGGGGRGMRVVESSDRMEQAFMACEAEAIGAFGDGTLYMEKFIESPRHVEVQVMGDQHGNAIHIGERDCSMQRRHQKLIEESPAEVLDDAHRTELHAAAVRATEHIGYSGAGTFEFLVDKHNNFYFMEMNTRLQVEHCVSEAVSGIDIIEWMIRVAEGKALPRQETIDLKGHAIECRITAEDPVSFLPSPGTITRWIAPGGKDVRIDTHAFCGYTIPSHYDSMIGKLIVWAPTREQAIAKMQRALDEFEVEGVRTTIDFHRKMMRNPDFRSNRFDTKYLEDYQG
jgi:acetyl-CoA carboxylase biotin carboxylase subunit